MSSEASQQSGAAPADAPAWGPAFSVCIVALANVIAPLLNENSAPYKALSRRRARSGGRALPSLLFASNRARGAEGRRPSTYWAFELLDPEHPVASHCLSTPLLLALHAVTVLYWVMYVVVSGSGGLRLGTL
jgi:hypothetical protein